MVGNYSFAKKNSGRPALVSFLSALIVMGVSSVGVASAYEVWVSDQSDTAKKSGGTLNIYDGAKLAADPKGTKPKVSMDLSGEVNKFCQDATNKGVRRPHMIFFTKDRKHAVISFLTGHVLVMDAETKKPRACVLIGKNVHAAWPTPDQKMIIAANIKEKTFVRVWSDYSSGKRIVPYHGHGATYRNKTHPS